MFYSLVIFLMIVLQVAAALIIIIFLLPLAVPYISNAESFQYINKAINLEKTIEEIIEYFKQ